MTSNLPRAAAATAVLLSLSATSARAQVIPDMVSRTALRVCSDPANLPFSDRQKQGFENKIADVVANELKEPVRYFWAPSGPGFVRNTLNSNLCDIIIGYTIGSELVQATNPYYRSTYVVVTRKGSPLEGLETLDDPKLKGVKLGVFAATPPVDVLLKKGLLNQAVVYPLIVDHRFESPLTKMIEELEGKTIDAAIVWGPLIGSAVKASNGALTMSPLLKDANKPDFSYRISFGIRHEEPEWKHKLEGVIRKRAADLNKVLEDAGVPLLDNEGHIITVEQAAKGNAVAPEANGTRERRKGPPSANGFQMPGPPPTNAPTGSGQ